MTLTPEKLDEIERLAECAEQDVPGPWEVDESGFDIEVVNTTDSRLEDGAYFCVCESDYNAIADYIVSLDPATVCELVRLARIGLTSSGESGVQRGGRAIQWPDGINTAEMPEDGAV